MRHILIWLVVAMAVSTTGCGDSKLQTKGRLLKSGQPCVPKDDEYYNVTFVPILPSGDPPGDYFFADFNPADGTFRPAGKDKKGLPPGKYRVAVEHMKNKKDQLEGKFDVEKSPFVFDIDSKTSEIVIDLDKLPTP